MASARIISHSPQSWRELALDLLTRGYTVEIVPPDKVPGNAADLELRVESDGATANIAARDGVHPNSLNLVHHSKAPVKRFAQKPLEAGGVARSPARTVNFDAGPRLLGEGWFWRASAGFVAVIALASALAMGLGRTGRASLAQNPGTDLRNTTAVVNTSPPPLPKLQPAAARADRSVPTSAAQIRAEVPSHAASPAAAVSQGNLTVERLLAKTDDLRVSAAIIDRDKAAARVATQSPPQKARHNEGDVIAPDTVTYLEGAAVTAKAREQ